MTILAGTGSRQLALATISEKLRILDLVIAEIRRIKPDTIFSGGAEGFDACLAAAAFKCGVPYQLILPNRSYLDYYWTRTSVTGTDRSAQAAQMVARAGSVHYVCSGITAADPHKIGKTIHANFARNCELLGSAHHALVYKPESSGTRHGVNELKLHRVPYTVIA